MSSGRRKQITENSNLWAVLTTDTFTPFLEFDFIGNDSWNCVFDLDPEELAALNNGEKLELRKHYVDSSLPGHRCDLSIRLQAARLEAQRMRQIYGYFRDSSGYTCSEWQTRKNLMQPLLEKPPWLAVWDRLLRRLVRMTSRLGCFIPPTLHFVHTFGQATSEAHRLWKMSSTTHYPMTILSASKNFSR